LTQIDQKFICNETPKEGLLGIKGQDFINSHFEATHSRTTIQLHIDWSIVGLGVMLTQFDDDGQKFMVAYVSLSNNKMEAKYNSY